MVKKAGVKISIDIYIDVEIKVVVGIEIVIVVDEESIQSVEGVNVDFLVQVNYKIISVQIEENYKVVQKNKLETNPSSKVYIEIFNAVIEMFKNVKQGKVEIISVLKVVVEDSLTIVLVKVVAVKINVEDKVFENIDNKQPDLPQDIVVVVLVDSENS